jgi:hypothetical protein
MLYPIELRVPAKGGPIYKRTRTFASDNRFESGGLAGTRTLDQCLKRALLYRLSYQPSLHVDGVAIKCAAKPNRRPDGEQANLSTHQGKKLGTPHLSRFPEAGRKQDKADAFQHPP